MTIRDLAAYLQSLPDQDLQVAFAEWHHDGWHYVTPMNLRAPDAKAWTFEKHGEAHRVVLNWDNCRAHKIPESLLTSFPPSA